MALNSCRLSDRGILARDELLKLVYSDEWNPTILSHDTGLEYGKTIPKILGDKDGGIQLKTLKRFFKKLLEKLQDRYNNDDVNKYIERYKLTSFCQDILKDDLDLTLPKDLYQVNKQVIVKDLNFGQPLKSLPRSPNFDIQLLESLWNLDYEAQETMFRTALRSQENLLTFTIAAPCTSTQSWILNRLLRKTVGQDNHKIFTIDLHESKIRNNFQSFLIHLSEYFKTSPDCENIVDELCKIDSNLSIILVINNFRKYREIQKFIMTKFWNELCNRIDSGNRAGRIIIFWVDERHLDYSFSTIELSELIEINQTNLNDWINEYRGLYPFLNNLSICDFVSDDLNWDWNDPWLILNNICQKFQLNGITDLQRLWAVKL